MLTVTEHILYIRGNYAMIPPFQILYTVFRGIVSLF
jgi:hypothetical protein